VLSNGIFEALLNVILNNIAFSFPYIFTLSIVKLEILHDFGKVSSDWTFIFKNEPSQI
jgi:hypothetical protein